MEASEKIVIDLTKCMANVGEKQPFEGTFSLSDSLLPYPNAHLVQATVKLNVLFLNPHVEAEGEIVCKIVGCCDRCLAETEKTEVLPFHQIFFKDNAEEDGYCYFGSKLDATKAVCDEIALSLPTLFLCKPDCKGLCPVCGKDINKGECGCSREKQNVFSALKNLKF